MNGAGRLTESPLQAPQGLPDIEIARDHELNRIPFPALEDTLSPTSGNEVNSPADSQDRSSSMQTSSVKLSVASTVATDVNSPADSQHTSSSKQTSSDKLSALPASKSGPNTHRFLHSPGTASNNLVPNPRGYRRSLDTSLSIPAFSNVEHDSPILWNSPGHRANSLGHDSPEKSTPKQRVSFDSDRGSIPTIQSVRQALSRITRASEPIISSPAQRSSAYRGTQLSPGSLSPGSHSPSQSRATSPLRIFQQWTSSRHRQRQHHDDPFVPINPYKFQTHFHFSFFIRRNSESRIPQTQAHTHTRDHNHIGPPSSSPNTHTQICQTCHSTFVSISTSPSDLWINTRFFFADTLPRELYLNILLRLPAMYFSRVARIFQDAEVSKPDIQRMIESGGGLSGSPQAQTFFGPGPGPSASEHVIPSSQGESGVGPGHNVNIHRTPVTTEYPPHAPGTGTPTLSPAMAAGIGIAAHVGAAALPFPDEWTPPLVSPALVRFKHSWEGFVDSLIREWKTLNVVSALLLSAILTMFQIPSAADDPVTRTAALLSLICALMSLSYGCTYIVRFGTMRSMFRAAKWAEEARKTDTFIWWNVWVLLAMPAVWMSWAMLLFITSILSFVWRTGSVKDPDNRPPLSEEGALGTRLAVTSVFALGAIYFLLIVRTLKSYGMQTNGSKAWVRRESLGVGAGGQTPRGGGGGDRGDVGDGNGNISGDGEGEGERRGRGRERYRGEGNGRREEGINGIRSVVGLGMIDSGEKDVEKGESVGL